MSKRYPGNFITGNPVALSQTSNSGVWDLKDNYHAVTNGTWQEVDGIYEISRSLRFRRAASAYLNRTSVTPTDGRKATFSFWIKKGDVSVGTAESYRSIFYTGTPNSDGFRIGWARYEGYENNGIMLTQDNGSSASHVTLFSTDVFRDIAAWYHFVIRYDSTDPIPNSRAKIFVNGREISSFTSRTNPVLNHIPTWQANGYNAKIGRGRDDVNEYADMYLTEVNFIDGQALDPSYFGYFDATTNIWQPKPYTGAYGNNGFYLPFTENNSSANLGRNFAGCNLLTYSEQFDNAAWSVTQGSVGANVTIAPNGATTADYLKGNGTNTFHYVNRNLTVLASTRYTFSVYVKKADYDFIQIGDQGTTGAYVYVNLNNGELPAVGSNNQSLYNVVATTQFVGAGWYRVTCSLTTGSSQTTLTPIIILLDNTGNSSFAGSTSAGTYIWGAHVNLGSTADRYIQTVASAPNTNWTTNNISLTAGTTYDSMVDSPVNVFTTATDVGGVVSGNYPTIDSLEYSQTQITYSDANLSYAQTANPGFGPRALTKATFQLPKTGKWVWAITIGSAGNNSQMGIARPDYLGNPTRAQYGTTIVTSDYAVMNPTGGVVKNGTEISTSSSIGVGDELQCAVDCDAGTVSWYRNGTYLGQATGMATTTNDYWPMTFGASSSSSGSGSYNFGQRPFAYTPPAGFKTLNTTNLQALGIATVSNAAVTPNKWFDTNLYAGTAATQTVTNSGFQPNFMWSKARGGARSWRVIDSVRGSRIEYYSDATNGEAVDGSTVRFESNGFTIDNSTGSQYNTLGDNYVSYQWKQSPTSGFNIISYTGNGASSRTITHNLGVAPKFIITKRRESSNWWVYHQGMQAQYPGTWLYLNLGFANQNTANATDAPYFKTDPTSSVFSIAGDGINTNGGTYMSYVWAEVPGFSKMGSYVGNGSSTDGPFVYTGFRPAFILTKNVTSTGYWWEMVDNKRSNFNPNSQTLYANVTDTEYFNAAYNKDLLSNGFKMRGNSAGHNSSGDTFVYVAFADSPFGLNNRAR